VINETQDPQIQRLFRQAADEINVPADLGGHANKASTPAHQRRRYWAIGGAAAATLVGIVAIATIRPGNQDVPSAASPPSIPEAAESPAQAATPPADVDVDPSAVPSPTLDAGPGRRELADLSITAATGYTPLESAQVTTAAHALIKQCMTARGLSYSYTPASSRDAEREEERRVDVMLFDDRDALAAEGYDALLPSSIPDGTDVSVNVATDTVTQDALARCQRESDQLLNPDGAQAGTNQVPGAVDAEQAMNNAMFQTLEPEGQIWSECMSRGGISGASHGSIPQQVTTGEATSVDTALLDARCRAESGYTDRLIEFRTTKVNEFLATNATEISEAEAARYTEVNNAKQVLSEQGITVD
jgi:hypothetical protein